MAAQKEMPPVVVEEAAVVEETPRPRCVMRCVGKVLVGALLGFTATLALAALVAPPPPQGPTVGIPHVIHQTYSSRGDLSATHEVMMKTWADQNPGFEMRFYDDQACGEYVQESFPEYVDAYSALELGAQRADLFRYLVVLGEGGVYADVDTEARAPIAPLLSDFTLVAGQDAPASPDLVGKGYVRPDQLQQYVFAAAPGHPALKAAADKAAACAVGACDAPAWGDKTHDVLERTGPGAFTDAVAANKDAKTSVLGKPVLSMKGVGVVGAPATGETVAVHHFDNSWRSAAEQAFKQGQDAGARKLLEGHTMGDTEHPDEHEQEYIMEMLNMGDYAFPTYGFIQENFDEDEEVADVFFELVLEGVEEVTEEMMEDIIAHYAAQFGVNEDEVAIVDIDYVVTTQVEITGITADEFDTFKTSIEMSFAEECGAGVTAEDVVASLADTKKRRSLLQEGMAVDVEITTEDSDTASAASSAVTESVDNGSFSDTLEETALEETGETVTVATEVTEEPSTSAVAVVQVSNATNVTNNTEAEAFVVATPSPSDSPMMFNLGMGAQACEDLCDDWCDDECEDTQELDTCDSTYTTATGACSCSADCKAAGWFIAVMVIVAVVVVALIGGCIYMSCKKPKEPTLTNI